MKNKETICVYNEGDYFGVNTPVFTSTSNKYIGYDEQVYPGYFNTKNQKTIVKKLSKLESAETGIVFSSGMAAISTTLLSQLKPDDHIIFSGEIYGGTHKFILEVLNKFNVEYDIVNGNNWDDYRSKIKANTKAIYTETPSNPLLSIVDLSEIVKISKENNLLSIVDNTFATPINQNPIELGMDIVIHSGTKYLGGHSDLSFGAVLSTKPIIDTIQDYAKNLSGCLNSLDCYLIERSLKTLAIRVEKHNSNAFKIAEILNENDLISKVYYPGLSDHLNHSVAKKQMKGGYGGMLSFELVREDLIDDFLKNLSLIKPSLSLGGVESIICQPSRTSHVMMSEEERIKLGITDNLLRLSVGIENYQDIVLDIEKALTTSYNTVINK